MSVFAELRRRNVIRAGIAYFIVAWLVAQVTDLVLDNIGAPGWVMKVILLLLAVGMPLVLFFSWAYEVTPEGIKRESEVDRSRSMSQSTARKLDRSITVLLVLALGYFIWESRLSDPPAPADRAAANETPAVVTESSAVAFSASKKSIAVLPFENRSNREEDEFFTDGIHDELLATIAKIGTMKVISRTSVMEYKGTTKKISVIARELGVANILEGGIQRAGDKIRVTVQLIDAADDAHLWAEVYDRDLNIDNLFAIQSEISRAIATALDVTLSSEERQQIHAIPTGNLEAYYAYLRGRQLLTLRDTSSLREAAEKFQQAVELDPEFALAWVAVAETAGLLYEYTVISWDEAVATRRDAVERALSINDRLGEAYTSLAWSYVYDGRFAEAEAAFRKAIELSPNYAIAFQGYAEFLREYPLRSREALEMAQKALELDPRSSILGVVVGMNLAAQGLYSMAERQYRKVLEADPNFAMAHHLLSMLNLWVVGRPDLSVIESRKAIELDPENLGVLGTPVLAYLELGDTENAQAMLARMTEIDADFPFTHFMGALIALQRNDIDAARKAGEQFSDTGPPGVAASLQLALRNVPGARGLYLAGNDGWLDKSQWPDLIRTIDADECIVAWVLMQTGDEALGSELLREATRFMIEELPDAVEHADVFQPETCYLAAKDTDEALASLETQLEHNHIFRWDWMHRSPMYDPIRNDPRYVAAINSRKARIAQLRQALESQSVN